MQPAALIIPNHHKAPLPGEDVQTFEQDLPGANTAGFNTREVGGLPLETSLTMNESWGFNLTDHKYKSPRELIHYLVRAAGYGANLLLNIGPRPDGTIPPEAEERLRAIGSWLATYGGSIYGTRAGPIAPRSWGVTTQRPHRDSVFSCTCSIGRTPRSRCRHSARGGGRRGVGRRGRLSSWCRRREG